MPAGSIELKRTIPGSTYHRPIVASFAQKGAGVVTSFNDRALPTLRGFVDDDSELEFMPFGALVARILTRCGEPCLRLASSGQELASMAFAVQELPDDSPFATTARFPGTQAALLRTLKELHAWGISAEELDRLAPLAGERLSAKLSSLAHLDRELRQLLAAFGRESHSDHLASAIQAMPDAEEDPGRILAFVGSEVHPARMKWLRWVADQGYSVEIVLDRHAAEGDLFRGSERIVQFFEASPVSIGAGNQLLCNLFAETVTDGPPIDITTVTAADSFAECEWALRGCLDSMASGSAAIFTRNLENYAPLLEAAAKRLEVPIRISRRVPLLANSFVRLTLALLESIVSRDVRTLMPMLKSSYLSLGSAERRRLESAISESHRARARQWDELGTWARLNETDFPWLVKVLQWRHEAMQTSSDLAEWLTRLRTLVDELPWHASLSAPTGYESERDVRAFSAMQSAIANEASVDRIARPQTITLDRFVDRCRRVWSEGDVSLPVADFGIPVVSDAASLSGVDDLYVLGMLEGVFPRRRSEDPILTDDERIEISALRPGEPELELSHTAAAAERDEFYRVCAAANRKIFFSYPLTEDNRENISAFYLTVAAKTVAKPISIVRPRPQLTPRKEELATRADRSLLEAIEGPRQYPAPADLTSESIMEALRRPPEHEFSPDELRDVLQCPFQYVAQHVLGLRPRQRSSRWYDLRRLPQASQLALASNPVDAHLELISALEAELDRLAPEIPEWEMPLLQAGGRRLIDAWVQREFLSREKWAKDSDSIRLNVPFGDEQLKAKLGKLVSLRGSVPAVSRFGRARVVHLYRSSVKRKDLREFSDSEILYYGLYLFAAYEMGQAAVLEVEGMGSERVLFTISRQYIERLGQCGDHLKIVVLGEGPDYNEQKENFFRRLKVLIKSATALAQEGSLQTHSGDHCSRCDFGELCRRSREFGEDDSPFGADLPRPNAPGGFSP